jgi:hypothetical protein
LRCEIERQLNQRDEEELNRPLFAKLKDKKNGEGFIIRDNMQEVNHMPDLVDHLQVVGRNLEVSKIVNYLDRSSKDNFTKIVHIYGPDGVGKTGIARYSAKFGLNRHMFPQGVFYLSLANKTEIYSLIDILYDKLHISRSGGLGGFSHYYDQNMDTPIDNLIK